MAYADGLTFVGGMAAGPVSAEPAGGFDGRRRGAQCERGGFVWGKIPVDGHREDVGLSR